VTALLRWPRLLNRLYAIAVGWFWLPCPLCGKMFGGHEAGPASLITYRGPGITRGYMACWRHDESESREYPSIAVQPGEKVTISKDAFDPHDYGRCSWCGAPLQGHPTEWRAVCYGDTVESLCCSACANGGRTPK